MRSSALDDTSSVGGRVLARFRLAYCLVLIPVSLGQLAFAHAQYRGPPETYIPIPLFRALHLGLLPEWVVWVLAFALVLALGLAAIGVRPRPMLIVSVLLFLGFFGATTGWRWKFLGSPEYAFEHALHPFILLLLASAPEVGRGRWHVFPRAHVGGAPSAAPAWPLSTIELLLGLSYWGAFYTKLADSGLRWADGYNLQTYLLEKYSVDPSLRAGLWLAQHHGLCQALSIGSLLFEGLFVTVVLVPRTSRLRWFYAGAGLSFHLMTWWTMGISVFALSYCAAYLVFLDAFWPGDASPTTSKSLTGAVNGGYGRAMTVATVLLFFGCIVGRVNCWPLCDWRAFSEHSDWRARADITRCEMHLPRGPVAGCVLVASELVKRVQVPIGVGETSDEAVREYVSALPKRQPPPPAGSQMVLQVRDYVTEDGVLQPRFHSLVLAL